MHKNINQLKMGTLLSYVTIAIQNISAIIYTPLMLRFLGQNEYGLYQLGSSTVSYLGLLSLGFGSSYVNFYYEYKVKNQEEEIRKLNGIFLLVFCGLAVLSCIVGGGMIISVDALFQNSLTAADVQQVRILMVILIFSMAVTFPNIIFDCYITAHERYIFQRIMLITVTILIPVISLSLLYMGYRSTALFW